MRILVTGASGLLGLNLALEMTKRHQVYGLVNNHNLERAPFEVLKGDLSAPGVIEKVFEAVQPDWVIHCAALAILDACEADPERARQLNSEVPAKLAAHVARGGARFLHISTDSVFDGQRGNYNEEDTPNPLSVYSRTKLEGERQVAEANPQAIIARVNLFGWSLTGTRSLSEFFFYNLQAGKQIQGFIDVSFCPLLANDMAYLLVEMLSAGLSGLYHVVGHECLTKYDFGVRLARQFGLDERLVRPVSVTEGGLKAARSPRLCLRTDKLALALSKPVDQATPTLSAALGRLYALYQQGYPQYIKGLSD